MLLRSPTIAPQVIIFIGTSPALAVVAMEPRAWQVLQLSETMACMYRRLASPGTVVRKAWPTKGPTKQIWNMVRGGMPGIRLTISVSLADDKCGYTVARWYFTGQPAYLGTPGYQTQDAVIEQGYGKGVLFWETAKQAAEFLRFSDILSADSYWMTDSSLDLASQGGCALFPNSPTICGNGSGSGLTNAQRQLPANYAYNVTKLEQLQSMNGPSKPVVVDVETGCPFMDSDACTTPSAMTAAAWHALIAGARGIIWFQHNFGGPCIDFRTIIDGSNRASSKYNCQQTPGVTEHDMVVALTKFNSEVNLLTAVLLSPFADGYVSSAGDVSYMAKYADGSFYIFAASGEPGIPPPSNQRVSFLIAGAHNCQVNVINEGRDIPVINGRFNDTFSNADSVHIYRVNC